MQMCFFDTNYIFEPEAPSFRENSFQKFPAREVLYRTELRAQLINVINDLINIIMK